MAPASSAPRTVLAICDKYADNYQITSDAIKSKCLVVLRSNCRYLYDYIRKSTFYVGKNPIDLIDSYVHLAHILTSQLTDNADNLKSRNEFFRQISNVLCCVNKLNASIKHKRFAAYFISMFGCELWLLRMPRSLTCVLHGEKVCTDFGDHRTPLTIISS
jgi:hypothetical protein